jgi:hypothetical protein
MDTRSKANELFKGWLDNLKEAWQLDIEIIGFSLAESEIHNRLENYPNIQRLLSSAKIDIEELRKALSFCWSLGGRFDQIRINRFLNNTEESTKAIVELLNNFPSNSLSVAKRVDTFIEDSITLGISKQNGDPDRPLAALLASVFLSSLYPEQFVDFRQGRWREFAKSLSYSMPNYNEASLGTKFVLASEFASLLASSQSFKTQWPGPNTLWVLSGIAWLFPKVEKPGPGVPPSESDLTFVEGKTVRRLHLIRERKQSLIRKFKEKSISLDPFLRCEICDFSFYEQYGEIGQGVIEAHHIIPLSKLNSSVETKLEDLACVCSNCHIMLHRGEEPPTMSELKSLIESH